MRKVNKFAAAIAVAATIGGGGVIAAAPASASSACPAGYACAWQHADYNTGYTNAKKVSYQYGIPDMRDYGFNDMASSLKNSGRTMNAVWYTDIKYGGTSWTLTRGFVVSDLAGSFLQDAISSARFV
jgi:hypothetical protein